MKKEVTYYLEDTSRLSEISQTELEAWIAEMPFHQPLQILASIKSEMEGAEWSKNDKVYAAYFAEDYELIKNGRSKNSNQRNKTTKQLAKTIDIQPEINVEENKEKPNSKSKKKLAEIAHDLADDALEDEVTIEVTEDFTKIKTISEISSDLASDDLEDEVITEVLEENISIAAPSSTIEAQENLTDLNIEEVKVEKIDKKDLEEIISDNAEPINEKGSDILKEESQIQMVDYFEYSNLKQEESEIVDHEDLSIIEVRSAKKDLKIDPDSSLEQVDLIKESLDLKTPKPSSKKDKSKDKPKKKKKKKGLKKKSKKEEKEETKKTKSPKKKKSKKKNAKKKKKKSEVKNLVGKVKKLKEPKKLKSKENSKAKTKNKKRKSDKEVKFVIVDSPKKKNFKLKDYDGVSSYTSWLLEQESINGNELIKTTQTKMKKTKKKKKKKKSKSLKIAIDSVKKKESIISEPLANILALQGHKKKARNMYSKLAIVFPEKKDYFEEKINSLN